MISLDLQAFEGNLKYRVPEEHLSDYYVLLDTNEGILSGLNEALCILQAAWLNYTERAL